MQAKKIADGIFKITAGSNAYLLDLGMKAMIDTGSTGCVRQLEKSISPIINPSDVKAVIFTHLHYDHCANHTLFPNAALYASEDEIQSFATDPYGTVLDSNVAQSLSGRGILPIDDRLLKPLGLELVKTPGHTKGSVCLFHTKSRALFSGDTFFYEGCFGRTDLPSSVPKEMDASLAKIRKLSYQILCPGHDY